MPRIALAGDVMLGRSVDEALHELSPEQPWGDFLPVLLGCDLRIVNLECALTRSNREWSRTEKVFHFRADPTAVEVLRSARIDACSLANNHVLDFEVEGLLETLSVLDRAGIGHAGAGCTLAEARRPLLLRAGDVTVALIAFTDNEPAFAATSRIPGTSYLPVDPDDEAVLQVVADATAAARGAGADVVILANHWGPNMVERPPPAFQAFARAAIDRGVDVWFGHSAHLVQGVELYKGRPILYDTGDFIDDYAVDPVLRNDRSFLFLVDVERGGPVRLELIPASLEFAHVKRATGGEASQITTRLQRLSRELGTTFRELEDHRLVLEPNSTRLF